MFTAASLSVSLVHTVAAIAVKVKHGVTIDLYLKWVEIRESWFRCGQESCRRLVQAYHHVDGRNPAN